MIAAGTSYKRVLTIGRVYHLPHREASLQQVPGFAVSLEAASGARLEPDAPGGGKCGYGEDVPDVLGSDVGGEQVDLAGGEDAVGALAEHAGDLVAALDVAGDGTDLDTVQAGACIHNDIVLGVVPIGLGHSAAEGDGAVHKGELAQEPFMFEVGDDAHDEWPGAKAKKKRGVSRAGMSTKYLVPS